MARISFMRHGERAYDNHGDYEGRARQRLRGGAPVSTDAEAGGARVTVPAERVSGPQFDAPVTPRGVEQVRSHFATFLKNYGPPDAIIVSPFARTRETHAVVAAMLQTENYESPMTLYDVRICEFLGNQGRLPRNTGLTPRDALQRVSPITASLYTAPVALPHGQDKILKRFTRGLLINESTGELRDRVSDFLDSARKLAETISEETGEEAHLLVISHGFTIAVARSLLLETPNIQGPDTGEILTFDF